MKKAPLLTSMAALVAAALLPACGGGATPTTVSPAATPVPEVPATTVASSPDTGGEMTPAELGDRIGEIYVEAIRDVVAALADRPDGAAALPALRELKEGYVLRLVDLGRQREALDPGERGTVDARIAMGLSGVPTDLFDEYREILAHYEAGDRDVAELIGSFNIITQYANFDLLAEQEPEEAARLLGD